MGLCHTIDVIQDVSEKYWTSYPVFVSHMWLSTNGLWKLQLTSGGEKSTDGGETSSEWAKRLGGEMSRGEASWGRNVLGQNVRWRGETSI